MSSPAPGRQTGSFGDELTNAAMIGLVALFGVALVLRAAGTITAWLTGTPQPEGGLAATLRLPRKAPGSSPETSPG